MSHRLGCDTERGPKTPGPKAISDADQPAERFPALPRSGMLLRVDTLVSMQRTLDPVERMGFEPTPSSVRGNARVLLIACRPGALLLNSVAAAGFWLRPLCSLLAVVARHCATRARTETRTEPESGQLVPWSADTRSGCKTAKIGSSLGKEHSAPRAALNVGLLQGGRPQTA